MLKVLIIDDERNIRDNLKTLISWEELGYIICGEADNGEEGLKKYNALHPDLVLLDIRMPGINGLDMIQAIKSGNEKAKIVIISGYSNFKYAKKAIEYGIDGYLLKPVDEDELKEKVMLIKEDIEKNNAEKELVKKSRDKFFEQFLSAFIKGEEIEEVELKKWFQYSSMPWKSYQIVLVDVNKPSILSQNQKEKMKKIINDRLISKSPGFIFEMDGKITCLYEKKITFSFLNDLNELLKSLKPIAHCDIALYIGKPVDDYTELGDEYKRITNMIRKSFFYRITDIVFASRISKIKSPLKTGLKFSEEDLIDQLYMAIDLNEEHEIVKIMSLIYARILNAEQEEEGVKSKYMSLLYTIIKRIAESREDMYYLLSDYDKMIHTIGEVKRIDELVHVIKRTLLKISYDLCVTRPRENVIQRVVEYIKKYYNTSIKLKNLSELFHYNSAYFGQLFKEKTGHRFNTYIDKVRIENAKQFLLKGKKVYEVAEQTGFIDVDNFYKKFKKYTGMSPSEYRKSKM